MALQVGGSGFTEADLYGHAKVAIGHPRGGFVVVGRVRSTEGPQPSVSSLARIGANGKRDASFGTEGLVDLDATFGPDCQATGTAVESKERIGVVAHCATGNRVARFLATGKIDTAFGKNGIVFDTHGKEGASTIRELVGIDGDDRIIVVGDNFERVIVTRFAP